MVVPAVIAFVCAFTISWFLTPVGHRLALKVGLTDKPDGNRKKQERPVALGGGVVVALSLFGTVGLFLLAAWYRGHGASPDWHDALAFALASLVIVLVGLIDGRYGLRGRHKLMGQIIAAGCLMWSGLVVQHINVFGFEIHLGLLSIPFTLFWLLGATNAINLLDGIDGLATTLGIILTATLSVMAGLREYYGVCLLALMMTGSLLGFLRYNLPAARMYLGDAGSMLIGLLVGALAIRASLKGTSTVLLAAPLAVWAIPILDSGAAIMRRRLSGRSIYTTDRGHLHHRLLEALGSNAQVLWVVGLCCVATSTGALISVLRNNDVYSLAACAGVVAILLATGMFGRAELQLLFSQARHLGVSLVSTTHVNRRPRESHVRLQGSQKWELLWETLVESAEKLQLLRLHLDVNAPALHESYVATWEHPDAAGERERLWHLELPLAVAEMEVGRLLVFGRRDSRFGLEEIARLIDLLEPFEHRLAEFTKGSTGDVPVLVQSTE